MSESLIKIMFSIVGTLLFSILMFMLIFWPDGQKFIWRAVDNAMVNQWNHSSLNSGEDRTKAYNSMMPDNENFWFDMN